MSRGHDNLLTADRLTHTLPDGRRLLDDLTLGFGRERTGLVGPNGIGKSTLVRVLVGELRPTGGTVVRHGELGYLPQQRVAGSRTVAELLGVGEALAALDRVLAGSTDPADYDAVGHCWNLRERVTAELARVGLGYLTPDRPIEALSGGEVTRVALASLTLDDADFLVLDEPTNDLDVAGRAALYRFVEEWTGGLLVVTHDRALLARVDRILELSGLGAQLYGGNHAEYDAMRSADRAAAEAELAHARTELRRTRRAAQEAKERQARRTSRARKSAATENLPKILLGKRRERGESTTRRLGEVAEQRIAAGREREARAKARVEARDRLELDLPPTGLHGTKRVAEATGLCFTHAGADAPVLDGLSFAITGPERIAVTGPNGSGKTTLLRLLAGELAPAAGSVRLGVAPDDVAYLDQHTRRLDPHRSVIENFRAANPALDPTATRHVLARYLFRADAAFARVCTLSGGERIRAALACTVNAFRPPALLLLDEPTNHLDLDSLRAVESVLAAYDGALVVVSHDETFLSAIGVDRRIDVLAHAGRGARAVPNPDTPPGTTSGRRPASAPD